MSFVRACATSDVDPEEVDSIDRSIRRLLEVFEGTD